MQCTCSDNNDVSNADEFGSSELVLGALPPLFLKDFDGALVTKSRRETMTTNPSPRYQWQIATLRCLAYSVVLLLWTRKVLLEPLRVEAIEMVRYEPRFDTLPVDGASRRDNTTPHLAFISFPSQAHMDPSEIIVVPIPLSRLSNFVGFSVLCLFVVSIPWWELAAVWRSVKTLTIMTCILLAASILCGAHPINNLHSTLLASFYVASLVSLNPPVFNDASGWSLQHVLNSRLTTITSRQGDEIMGTCRFYTTLLVMIPFQILNILDSGLQVQRWPLPIVLGSTVGWVIGSTMIGLPWALYTNFKANSAVVNTECYNQSHRQKDRYI